jgi:hypothetical protein
VAKFVVYVSNAPGQKSGLTVKSTEADARGAAHELCIALKPTGSKEYDYQEISLPVCAFARAMRDNPEKDPRSSMSQLTPEQFAELELLLEAQERDVSNGKHQ